MPRGVRTHGPREALVKAHIVEPRGQPNALEVLLDRSATVEGKDLLAPPYDPVGLVRLWENSGVLRQLIDAYVTNVDSFGHRFEAALDLGGDEADDHIRDALFFENAERGAALDPTPEEIQVRKDELRRRARIEFSRLRSFFAYCCPDYSFVELRRQTRQDLEITGNAYWEVLRDEAGQLARLNRVPPAQMRLTRLDKTAVEIEEWTPVTEITWQRVRQRRFFRRYAQVIDGKPTYFKEYGDPRVASMRDGAMYPDRRAFERARKEKEDDREATEIIHFAVPHPDTAYGVPRWIGNLPTVLGLRELDEVNYAYFENKTVPPLALIVAGGRLGKSVVPKIEEYIEDRLKGKANFHRILIIEAEMQRVAAGVAPTHVPKVQFVPLREAQQQDALFQNYEEKGTEKVGSSFRLPRILVGRDRAINRATASASLRFAEDQVFNPERERFDNFINRRIVAELGVRFWALRSNAPVARDPEVLTDLIVQLAQVGVVTPQEGRELAADVLNRRFPEIKAPWASKPLAITLAETRGGMAPGADAPRGDGDGVEDDEAAVGPSSSPSVFDRAMDGDRRRDGDGGALRALRPLGEDSDDAVGR